MSVDVDPDPAIDLTIGAGLIGFAITGMARRLYGITTGQAIIYYYRHGIVSGGWRAQCFVGVIWCLDTLHMIFLSSAMYYYDVPSHGNPAELNRFLWPYAANLLAAEANTALVRLGYAHRIWIYNGRKACMPILVIVLSIAILATGFVFGGLELKMASWSEIHTLHWIFYVAFAMRTIADTAIVISMLSVCCRFHTGLKRFDEIVQAIMVFFINTGILSLVLNTLCVVFYVCLPKGFLFLATYWVLTKMHVCSFLAVLNAEKTLVAQTSSHARGSAPLLTTELRVEDFTTTLLSTRLDLAPLSDLSVSRNDAPSASVHVTRYSLSSRPSRNVYPV